MENLTAEQIKALEGIDQQAADNKEAVAKASSFRIGLAVQGAGEAAYAVEIFKRLVKADPNSPLGQATNAALRAFDRFGRALADEISAASAQEAPADVEASPAQEEN